MLEDQPVEGLARELAARRGLDVDNEHDQVLVGDIRQAVHDLINRITASIPPSPNRLRWLSVYLTAWAQHALRQQERSTSESRRFHLQRDTDITGASGTGHVADGIQFPDGTTVIRWRHEHASTVVWTSIDSAIAVAIHGHDGSTRIVWDD